MSDEIFLTGATGFVGRSVLAELRRSGRPITALVRRPTELDGCRTVVGDLFEAQRFAERVAEAGAIVHLASTRSQDRLSVLQDDVDGTGQIIDAWQTGTFVYASSTTIHGVPRGAIGPGAPIDLLTWYDVGKAAVEFALRDAAERGPAERRAIALRPTIYIGTNSRATDRQVVGDVYLSCRAGATFVFESDAALEQAGAAYVGTDDFARAVSASLALPASGAYPVATGFVQWRELIDAINDLGGFRGRYVVRPHHEAGEVRVPDSRTEVDSTSFREATGWRPQQDWRELVGELVREQAAA